VFRIGFDVHPAAPGDGNDWASGRDPWRTTHVT